MAPHAMRRTALVAAIAVALVFVAAIAVALVFVAAIAVALVSAGCARSRAASEALEAVGGADGEAGVRTDAWAADEDEADASSRDPAVRRAAAQQLARSHAPDEASLFRWLEDEDDEVVAWAAFGLGESCAGHESAHTRALASRLASLRTRPESDAPPALSATSALLRALGRCGAEAAGALEPWLGESPIASQDAAFALADQVSASKALGDALATHLLDAAERAPPLDAALMPFSVFDAMLAPALAGRFVVDARRALGRAGPERTLALLALAQRASATAVPDVAALLASQDTDPTEALVAVRALSRSGPTGRGALASLLSPPPRVDALVGGRFAVWLALLAALPNDLADAPQAAVTAMSRLALPADASPGVMRRVSLLRCAAALHLAHAVWDADVLTRCDLGDGQVREGAELQALDRRSLMAGRAREAWVALSRSPHPRVREGALELAARHPELGVAARAAVDAGCRDPRAAIRARAARACEALGMTDVCESFESPASANVDAPPVKARIALTTDAGPLVLTVDPTLAPQAAGLLVALARSGALVGTTLERGPSGLLVNMGEPGAETAAGSAAAASAPGGAAAVSFGPAELAPVAMRALDLGVMPASKSAPAHVFVSLARTPWLDGRAAWLGKAEGPWASIADGDVIRAVAIAP